MNHRKSNTRNAKSTEGGKSDGAPGAAMIRTQGEPLSLGLVPADVRDLMERLRAKGHGVWIVGGAVRDLLTGVVPRDWDVATDAGAPEILDLFPKVIPLGLRYGTLQVHTSRRQVEVTSLATTADGNILKDLARRDFTINALALVFPAGELLDPHQGRADLERKTLRAVGDPAARLMEDPLRMLRAARFVSTLGLRPAPSTVAACRDRVHELERTAPERIREEFYRILMGTKVADAFEFLRRTGILEKLLPEFRLDGSLRGKKRLLFRNYRHAVGTLSLCPFDRRVRLAALFHCLGNPCPAVNGGGLSERIPGRGGVLPEASRVMTRWKTAHKEMREVSRLLDHWIPPGGENLSLPALRRLVLGVGEEMLEDLVLLGYADRREAGNEGWIQAFDRLVFRIREQVDGGWIVGRSQLDISGEDVMKALGIDPGPRVGRFLEKLHDFVIEDPRANRREILIEKLRQISSIPGPPIED